MSKERGTTIAVAKVFAGIVIGLCVPVIVGIIAPASLVATEAQSRLPSATPLASAGRASSKLDLRIVFYGYPKQGVPQSGTAVISEAGLSNIRDVTFTSIGGELAPNGRFIAYDNCSTVNRGIYLAELDGRKAQMVIPLSGGLCVDARWSPDSAKLSYTAPQDRSLHIFDIASKRDTLIPNTRIADWHWWSPSGKEIVYGRIDRRDPVGPGGPVGPVHRLLYITDLTGNSRQLTFAKDFVPCEHERYLIDIWAPTCSPDGKTIAFTQCGGLFVISPTGKDLKQLTTPRYVRPPLPQMPVTLAYSPRWSPDGRWILFIGDDNVLKRISVDGKAIVDIGKLPYWGGPFSIAPFNK
jgi:WD40 repeat protein